MPEHPENRPMQKAFDKARRATEAKYIRLPKDWKNLQEIEQQAERLRAIARGRHKAQYKDRVNKEIVRLLDDRYSPQKIYKPKVVGNLMDIKRQAEKNVRKHHQQRISRINLSEENQVERLRYQARGTRGHEMAFERTTPGRDGFKLVQEFKRKR